MGKKIFDFFLNYCELSNKKYTELNKVDQSFLESYLWPVLKASDLKSRVLFTSALVSERDTFRLCWSQHF